MIVEKSKVKVKCDASGCSAACMYTIINKRFIFDGSVYLCEKCFNDLYTELGKFVTPKNIKPIYKKGAKDE